MKSYPLSHALNAEEIKALGHDKPNGRKVRPRAVLAGEARKPRKGEWFFAVRGQAACRAEQDLDRVFTIARLVPQL